MEIDIARQIGAVGREVRTSERDGTPMRTIVLWRVYETTQDDLWDAVTNPERLPRWFSPVSGDFELGGRYSIEGNAEGEITRCEPPRHLSLTWEFQGNMSWVDVEIGEAQRGARLELAHTAPEDEHWKEFGPGAAGVGWDLAFIGLAEHLVHSSTLDLEEGAAWMVSEEGKAFMRRASERWGDAHLAAGTDQDEAHAAAARTAAFYTGGAPADPEGVQEEG
jgi:uncharacterized protein YndB with AHSA1/START domain